MAIFKGLLAFLLIISLLTSIPSLSAYANKTSLTNISAKSACLIEAEGGRVLYSKSGSTRMPMASTTKIMTAIVALESRISLDTQIRVPKEAVGVEGSSVYLKHNEAVTLEMLLYALMLSSANDAAVAIACTVSGSVENFVALMNNKAQDLGLTNTHFTNPHGLYDDEHYTSAEDLAKIMVYAMKNEDFAKITAAQTKAFAREDGTSFLLTNHNKLLRTYDGIIGGKTGFTKKSGRCLVSCAERDGLRLIAVTLNAPNDWNDHKELYDFGFSIYKRVYFDAKSLTIPVISGDKSAVSVASDSLSLVLPQDHGEISVKINAPRFLFASVKKGEQVGDIVYSYGGKIIATSPLYACENVSRTKYKFNPFDWLIDFIKGIFK